MRPDALPGPTPRDLVELEDQLVKAHQQIAYLRGVLQALKRELNRVA